MCVWCAVCVCIRAVPWACRVITTNERKSAGCLLNTLISCLEIVLSKPARQYPMLLDTWTAGQMACVPIGRSVSRSRSRPLSRALVGAPAARACLRARARAHTLITHTLRKQTKRAVRRVRRLRIVRKPLNGILVRRWNERVRNPAVKRALRTRCVMFASPA